MSQHSKTQIVPKQKKSNGDKSQKLKLWPNLKIVTVTKLKNKDCNETQIATKQKTQIATKLKNWNTQELKPQMAKKLKTKKKTKKKFTSIEQKSKT